MQQSHIRILYSSIMFVHHDIHRFFSFEKFENMKQRKRTAQNKNLLYVTIIWIQQNIYNKKTVVIKLNCLKSTAPN